MPALETLSPRSALPRIFGDEPLTALSEFAKPATRFTSFGRKPFRPRQWKDKHNDSQKRRFNEKSCKNREKEGEKMKTFYLRPEQLNQLKSHLDNAAAASAEMDSALLAENYAKVITLVGKIDDSIDDADDLLRRVELVQEINSPEVVSKC
jgi:hypothetical protein